MSNNRLGEYDYVTMLLVYAFAYNTFSEKRYQHTYASPSNTIAPVYLDDTTTNGTRYDVSQILQHHEEKIRDLNQ